MLVISMREFRTNQGKYLGMARNGEDVILESRENGSFTLTPVAEFISIPEEYILEPDENIQEDIKRALTFEEFRDRSLEHIRKLYSQKGK